MDLSCFATLLCLYSVTIPVLSLECSHKQYQWPSNNPQRCCDKCEPGQYMKSRNLKPCFTTCLPCTGERYTDSYNVERCKLCNDCNKRHMVTVTPCTSTSNAVCRCEKGYTCADDECTYCKGAPTVDSTTRTTIRSITDSDSTPKVLPPLSASTTSTTTTSTTSTTTTAWFLIIIFLLCLGLALVIVTQMKPLQSCFRRHKGHCLVEKPTAALVSMPTEEEEEEEEEEPSTPVQEMCGKCDQPIDV